MRGRVANERKQNCAKARLPIDQLISRFGDTSIRFHWTPALLKRSYTSFRSREKNVYHRGPAVRRSSRQMKFMAAPGRFVRSEMKETRETRIETGGRTTRDLQKNIKKVQRLVTICSFFFFFKLPPFFQVDMSIVSSRWPTSIDSSTSACSRRTGDTEFPGTRWKLKRSNLSRAAGIVIFRSGNFLMDKLFTIWHFTCQVAERYEILILAWWNLTCEARRYSMPFSLFFSSNRVRKKRRQKSYNDPFKSRFKAWSYYFHCREFVFFFSFSKKILHHVTG